MIKSLEKFKLEYEDLPGYEDVRLAVKVLKIKRAWAKRRKSHVSAKE